MKWLIRAAGWAILAGIRAARLKCWTKREMALKRCDTFSNRVAAAGPALRRAKRPASGPAKRCAGPGACDEIELEGVPCASGKTGGVFEPGGPVVSYDEFACPEG